MMRLVPTLVFCQGKFAILNDFLKLSVFPFWKVIIPAIVYLPKANLGYFQSLK